ncbi:hypothetical protein Aduo_006978 [Ancylostoma duodenale]
MYHNRYSCTTLWDSRRIQLRGDLLLPEVPSVPARHRTSRIIILSIVGYAIGDVGTSVILFDLADLVVRIWTPWEPYTDILIANWMRSKVPWVDTMKIRRRKDEKKNQTCLKCLDQRTTNLAEGLHQNASRNVTRMAYS